MWSGPLVGDDLVVQPNPSERGIETIGPLRIGVTEPMGEAAVRPGVGP